MRERVSGPEHPATVTVRGNFAWWSGEAGDAAAARDLYAALLPVFERVSGPEHPDTLTVRGNFAWWSGEAGGRGRRPGPVRRAARLRAGVRPGAPGHCVLVS